MVHVHICTCTDTKIFSLNRMMIRLLPVLLLLTGGFPFSPSTSCEALELYVTPTQPPNPACLAGKVCYTLEDLINNASSLLKDNDQVSLLFLDGIHKVINRHLEISNIENLTISALNKSYNMDNPQTAIEVISINIANVSKVIINNVRITADIVISEVPNLLNEKVVMIGMVSVTAADDIQLRQSKYSNIAVISKASSSSLATKLTITDCTLEEGLFDIENHFEGELQNTNINKGRGIQFELVQGKLIVDNCDFSSTTTGGLGVQTYLSHNTNFNLELKDCNVKSNSESGINIKLDGGGKANVTISNCNVSNNRAGLRVYNAVKDVNMSVLNTNFTMNGQLASLVFINTRTDGNKHLLLRNVTFSNNKNLGVGSLLISGPVNMTIDDSLFTDNQGFVSTIYLYAVNLFFVGETEFSNNFGSNGGALHLSESTIWLDNGTSLTFTNNTADKFGGAIYIQESQTKEIFDEVINPDSFDKCFYQFLSDSMPVDEYISILFENNTARKGGDDIYGASLKDECTISEKKSTKSYEIQKVTFEFKSQSLSPVSSNPKRVCLCDKNGEPQCDNIEHIFKDIATITGEKFKLSVVLVGDDFGTVTGGIHASKLTRTTSFSFGIGHDLQQLTTNKQCTDLEYSIHSNEDEATFILSRDSTTASSQRALFSSKNDYFGRNAIQEAIDKYHSENVIQAELITVPLVISVTLLPCPLGFNLTGDLPTCKCINFLRDVSRQCTISNRIGLIYRNGTTWVSYFQSEANETDSILVQEHCTNDYCKSDDIGVDLYNPDTQCAFNHSGILCGRLPT